MRPAVTEGWGSGSAAKGACFVNWYRLAICEDDPGERRVLEGLCQEILAGRKIPAQITVFPHTGLLAEALGKDSQAFDLLLLDIQMEEKTGMELAKDLRAQGNQVRILFVTGAPQYALEGYQVGPIHYLLKPVEREALERVLVSDWEKHHQNKTVMFRAGTKLVPLEVEDISFVESLNRALVVHTQEGERLFSTTLSEAERLLPAGRFARCHNSFLVNLSQVKEVGRTSLSLRSGESLPVGRKFYRDFQAALVSWVNS